MSRRLYTIVLTLLFLCQCIVVSAQEPTVTVTKTNPTCPGTSNESMVITVENTDDNGDQIFTDGSFNITVTNNSAGGTIVASKEYPIDASVLEVELTVDGLDYEFESGGVTKIIEYRVEVVYGGYSIYGDYQYFTSPSYTADAVIAHPAACVDNKTSVEVGEIDVNGFTMYWTNRLGKKTENTSWTQPVSWEWVKEGDDSFPTYANETSISGLEAGTYYVKMKVTDDDCYVMSDPIIVEPAEVSISASQINKILCKGEETGVAQATVTNTYGDFVITWNGYATPANVTTYDALPEGDVTVTVVDELGCTASNTVSILTENPEALTLTIASTEDLLCKNAETGKAIMTATNVVGTPVYTWNDGGSGASRTNLRGNYPYVVTVTDDNGCTDSKSFTLSEPDEEVLISKVSSSNPTCYGYSDGTIVVKASGGAGNYTYEWTEGTALLSETTETLATARGDIDYAIVSVDANGCKSTALHTTLSQPASMSPIVTIDGVETHEALLECNGESATVAISATGGTGSKLYSWNGGEYGSVTEQTLTAGVYSIAIQDANGCIETEVVTINEPEPIIPIIEVYAPIQCSGDTGELQASVTGGNGDYSYTWKNGNDEVISTSQTSGSVTAGTYSVAVVDSKGCAGAASQTSGNLEEPPVLKAVIGLTPESCTEVTIDQIQLITNVEGGTPDYTYNWSEKIKYDAVDESYLSDGETLENLNGTVTYKLVVTDANGCSSSDSIDMRKISTYKLHTNKTKVSCPINISNPSSNPGTHDGVISTQIIGGYDPFTITWTSDNGLEKTLVDVPNSCDTLVHGNDLDSYGHYYNRSIVNSVYASMDSLSAGTYTFKVKDYRGCVLTDVAEILTIDSMRYKKSVIVTPSACVKPTGAIGNYTITKGTPLNPLKGTYNYQWYDSESKELSTDRYLTDIAAGTYILEVEDKKGCYFKDTIVVPMKNDMVVSAITEDTIIHCVDGTSGSATVAASGGPTPYTFTWSSGTYDSSTGAVQGLSKGVHIVTATDDDGCVARDTLEFVENDILEISSVSVENVTCQGMQDGSAELQLEGYAAQAANLSIAWSNGSAGTIATSGYSVQNLDKGSYSVKITDEGGCEADKSFTVTEPDAIVASVSVSEISCPTVCNAQANLTVSGGTEPYSYTWSSGETTMNATSLCRGEQSVEIVDANNCKLSASEMTFVVPVSTDYLRISSVTMTKPTCGEVTPTGEIALSVAGGASSGVYTYTWSHNSSLNLATASGLTAGTYSVTITDGYCSIDTVLVLKNSDMTATADVVYVSSSCTGDTYQLKITGEDESKFVSYSWKNEAGVEISTEKTVTDVQTGTYTVSAIDNTGCELVESYAITQKELTVTATSTDIDCYGRKNGSLTATVNEFFSGTVTYDLYNSNDENMLSQTTPTFENILALGTYYVKAYDANHTACPIVSNTVTIAQPDPMRAKISVVENAYCALPNGSAKIELLSTGQAPYSYVWSGGDADIVHSDISAITDEVTSLLYPDRRYTVTVTDNVGCSFSDTVRLSNRAAFELIPWYKEPIHCIGDATGVLSITPNGGYEAFSYVWSHDASLNASTATGLTAGTYSVVVTDAKGCEVSYAFDELTDPDPMVIEISEEPKILCHGGNGSLVVSVITGGTPPYTYQWTGNGSLLSEEAELLEVPTGTYAVKAIDNYGCQSDEFSHTLQEPDALTADFDVELTGCNTKAETGRISLKSISGGMTGATYRFSWADITEADNWMVYGVIEENNTMDNLPAGTYICTITDAENPEDCYISETFYTNPIKPVAINTIQTDATCNYYSDEDKDVGLPDGSIEITSIMQRSGISDASTEESADLSKYTYAWSDEKSQTTVKAVNLVSGTYTVTVTEENECSETFDAGVISASVNPLVSIVSYEDSVQDRHAICYGDSIQLTAILTTTYAEGYERTATVPSFEWTALENNVLSSIHTPTEQTTFVRPLSLYYSDSAQVSLQYTTGEGCKAQPVLYTINHYDSLGFAVQVLDSTGLYMGDDSVAVMKDLAYILTPVDEPWFVDKVDEDGVVSIYWRSVKPGSMERGSINDATVDEQTYLQTGSYGLPIYAVESATVYAVAITTYGCLERDTLLLDVVSTNTIPSGFTPNGDGINDTWVIPYLRNCPKAQVTIYNRWGTLVYENKKDYYKKPWNGDAKTGNPLPIGTYYYVIEYNDNHQTPTSTGSVSILR